MSKWLKSKEGAICPKYGSHIRYHDLGIMPCDHGEGCKHIGKMSYVWKNRSATVECHYPDVRPDRRKKGTKRLLRS